MDEHLSIHLFPNIIASFISAQFITNSEFFDACEIEKFWLFLQLVYGNVCEVENLSDAGHTALRKSGFEEMRHPPYSPDVSPDDYHLFPNLKKHLRRLRFSTDDELK